MWTSIAILLVALTPVEYAAAEADRAQYPVADQPYIFYLTTSHLAGEHKAACEATTAFVVASSSRQAIVEKCVPVEVQDALYRINLADLKWDYAAWKKLLLTYPYSRAPGSGAIPLVVRADWLVIQLADTTGSDGYYSLLYGTTKLDRDTFFKFWGVSNDREDMFAIIVKSKSPIGPSVAGLRDVERRPTSKGGNAWATKDSAKITAKNDPRENLAGDYTPDAQEFIVGMPKVSTATGERGILLAYLLSDGKGTRQEEAPAAIVTDHSGFRGQDAIRNWGSCVQCHKNGILDPGVSEFRTYVLASDIYAKPKELQEQIDLYRGSSAAKLVQRENEDYAIALRAVNGLDGDANADAFRGTIEAYDREITIETAAAEHHTTPKELRLAIAYYNLRHSVSGRLADLAAEEPVPMPRTRWEEQDGWYTTYLAVQAWEKSK